MGRSRRRGRRPRRKKTRDWDEDEIGRTKTRIGTREDEDWEDEDEDEDEEEEEDEKSKALRNAGTSESSFPCRRTIWTIGHSNHPLEVFLDLLARHGIDAVVDVRSSPYSRYVSHFNREAIHAALVERAIQYVFLGDLLGGRTDDRRFYDDEGRVLYGEVAQSPGFRQGIERLLGIAQQTRTAILCGEEDPTDCHRRLLVGRVLGQRGVGVIHSAATAASNPRPNWPPKRNSARPKAS